MIGFDDEAVYKYSKELAGEQIAYRVNRFLRDEKDKTISVSTSGMGLAYGRNYLSMIVTVYEVEGKSKKEKLQDRIEAVEKELDKLKKEAEEL